MYYDPIMANVWLSGVMLYGILYGRYPFEPEGDFGNTR